MSWTLDAHPLPFHQNPRVFLLSALFFRVLIALSWSVGECPGLVGEQPCDAILGSRTGRGCLLRVSGE